MGTPLMNRLRQMKAIFRLGQAFLPALGILTTACSQNLSPKADISPAVPAGLRPSTMVASSDGQTLYLACSVANEIRAFDISLRQARKVFATPDSPSGLALSRDGTRLFVTCAAPRSTICIFDTVPGKLLKTLTAGHTASSPVLSRDEKTLFVCNRFNDAVFIYDLPQGREVARVEVTLDGRFLLVANHLPRGRSDVSCVAACISVVDVSTRKVAKELRLPNGSIL